MEPAAGRQGGRRAEDPGAVEFALTPSCGPTASGGARAGMASGAPRSSGPPALRRGRGVPSSASRPAPTRRSTGLSPWCHSHPIISARPAGIRRAETDAAYRVNIAILPRARPGGDGWTWPLSTTWKPSARPQSEGFFGTIDGAEMAPSKEVPELFTLGCDEDGSRRTRAGRSRGSGVRRVPVPRATRRAHRRGPRCRT